MKGVLDGLNRKISKIEDSLLCQERYISFISDVKEMCHLIENKTRIETLELFEDSIRKGRFGNDNDNGVFQERMSRLLKGLKERGGADCLEELILLL